MNNSSQVLSLFLLALPIASIAWTITHEEVVREFRDICPGKSTTCRRIYERKFFYFSTVLLLQPLRCRDLSSHHSLQTVVSWTGADTSSLDSRWCG